MADCIDALITANIKTALETITIANGYNTAIGTVEEKRSILRLKIDNGAFALLERLQPEFEGDYQHTQDDELRFMVYYFNGSDDEGDSDQPIQYRDRNVHADIQKVIMVDRTRGGYAQNTEVRSHGHDYYYQQGTVDVPIMCTWVLIHVKRLINADNPYQLA